MKHDKTFTAINKLKDIELELHRLKNALEMANKALDSMYNERAARPWVKLTDEEAMQICVDCGCMSEDWLVLLDAIEAKLKEKNT
jgi:uncharacterized protein YajQ (UPF0234 family)